MAKFDVQSLELGPKPRQWAASVLGNLEKLAGDQSVKPEVREILREVELLLIDLLSKGHKVGAWKFSLTSMRNHNNHR